MADIDKDIDIQGADEDVVNQVLADEDDKEPQEPVAPKPEEGPAEPEPEPPKSQPTTPPPNYVPIEALREERQHRQQLQQQLIQLMQQITEMQKPQPPQKEEDPLAAMIAQQLEQVMPKYLTPLQEMQKKFQEFQQNMVIQQRVLQSDAAARMKYQDYDEVVAPIVERAKQDEQFKQLLFSMPDPAEYAYTLALGLQAQQQRLAASQGQIAKMQQMAQMPRSTQIKGGGAPSSDVKNIEDLVDNFEKLTPEQQARLLKFTGV